MEDEILGEFDYHYLLSQFQRAKEHKWIKRYVTNIEIKGLDNLILLKDKHFVIFSNHKSHFDYIGLGYLFLEHLYLHDFPRIIAGKNLDSRLLAFLGLDFRRIGAFFVDRERIGALRRDEKREYLKKVERLAVDALYQGWNFVDFFEGGRDYFGNPVARIKTGFMRNIVEAIYNPFIDINPLVVCCALDYDKVIEAEFFPILKFAKKNARFLYYSADALAFLARPFLREGRGNMYVNFSQAKKLREIADSKFSGKRVLQLRDYVKEEITRLYGEIRTPFFPIS